MTLNAKDVRHFQMLSNCLVKCVEVAKLIALVFGAMLSWGCIILEEGWITQDK